jgi:pyruvate dehydrogenase E2 component (dihydrolipoamide acetyltransferase)
VIVDITMPRLSDTMQEGYLVAWHKAVGDTITSGEDLVDIESDKATLSYQCEHSGTVVELVAEIDEAVDVGAVIARVDVAG